MNVIASRQFRIRNCTRTMNTGKFARAAFVQAAWPRFPLVQLLPGCETGSGRGRVHILASSASRWKDLSSSERDRACGKAFDRVKSGETDE